MSKQKKILSIILALVSIGLIVLADQYSKYVVIQNMTPYVDEIDVIGDYFVIYHIWNTGTAWGLFADRIPLLLVITVIVFLLLTYVFKNIAFQKRYRAIRYCMIMIVGGAIGNLIDRVRLGHVTDFLYAKVINFPIFNVADIFVTLPVILLVILMIFYYTGDDFDVIIGEKVLLEDGTYKDKKEKKSQDN